MTGGTLYNSAHAASIFTGVSIDSRSTHPGELFFAIRGSTHDGHDFIGQAIEKGAKGVVMEYTYPRPELLRGDIGVVAVHDSHEAMMALAKKYRETSQARFIGITGSNGKTTTKELAVRLIKSKEERAYGTPGNLNNLFGTPLALFAMPADTKVAIMELGISTPGEMTRLAHIVQPEVIVITNVGPSHLEFLETIEAVAQAKLELVKAVGEGTPVILNADDPILMAEAKKIRGGFVTFAIDGEADFTPQAIEQENTDAARVTIEGHSFELPLVGQHQVYNLLAAYALYRTLGYSFDNIDTQRISLGTAPWRGEIVRKNNITFLADCYNANPDSVKAGLKAFFETPGGDRRLVILGDMLELGTRTVHYHREVGRLLAKHTFDLAVFVGEHSKHIMQEVLACGIAEHKVRHYHGSHECAQAMSEYFAAGDFVYVKASRGIGLEAVIEAVRQPEEGD